LIGSPDNAFAKTPSTFLFPVRDLHSSRDPTLPEYGTGFAGLDAGAPSARRQETDQRTLARAAVWWEVDMRLARRGCLAVLGALAVFVLGVLPARIDAQTQPTAPAVPPHIDLSDPRVRERLRAAGIDPAELERLRAQHTGKPQAAPEAQTQFPPVTPAQAAAPATPLPGAAPADSTAEVPEAQPEAAEYFGYDIFTMSPKTFEPLTFGPVPANYLVGPGDEIIVSVWGAQELSVRAEVNREGYLLIPDLGQVLVNGYTLDGLKEHLENRLSRIYSGIRSDGQRRTWVEVSLGKLRSIQVFVLGDVIQPGGYMLTATSTVLNALYYAGGPALTGTLRDVRVVRGSKTLRNVDLYE
jgi:protein involved in polysaccharide export with SLBB domain